MQQNRSVDVVNSPVICDLRLAVKQQWFESQIAIAHHATLEHSCWMEASFLKLLPGFLRHIQKHVRAMSQQHPRHIRATSEPHPIHIRGVSSVRIMLFPYREPRPRKYTSNPEIQTKIRKEVRKLMISVYSLPSFVCI